MKALAVRLPLVGGQSESNELRKILGNNLFDAGDWLRYYPQWVTPADFENAPPPPPLKIFEQPDDFLKEKKRKIKETFFTFLSPSMIGGEPLTLLKFEAMHPPGRRPCFRSERGASYHTLSFARKTYGARWYCVRIRVLPGSRGLMYGEQKELLVPFPEYEVPCAFAEILKEILFFHLHPFRRYANRCYLGSSTVSARCGDEVDEEGNTLEVGLHDRCGLCVSLLAPKRADPHIGLAVARKLSE